LISGHSESGSNGGKAGSDDVAAKMQVFDQTIARNNLAVQNVTSAGERVDTAQQAVLQARKSLDDWKNRVAQYEIAAKELPGLQAKVDSATIDPTVSSVDAELARKRITEINESRPDQGQETGLNRSLLMAEEQLSDAIANQKTRNDEQKAVALELRQAREAVDQVNRFDSYSVFGSFEAKSSAKASGEASVGLGKIFATGVASQNISDGLSDYYRSRAITSCYEAISKLAETRVLSGQELADVAKHCPKLSDYSR
jgi:hypothetical protein